jgi:Tol biopolymer transport system component
MSIALRPVAVVPRAVLYVALLGLLLVILTSAVLLAGASPSVPPAPIIQNGLIAFESAAGIQVANPDGSAQRVLIPGNGNDKPVWSPDGSHLAYEALGPGSNWKLIVVNADGSQPVTVATGTTGDSTSEPSAAWSPDGKSLAYSATAASTGTCNVDLCNSRIFVAAADGSGSQQVGDPTLDARSPAWSPDGRTIAFGGGNASQPVHLYLMDAAGTNVRQLSDVSGTGYAFLRSSWSHDGTMVAGQAGNAAQISAYDIWTIPVDGSAPTDVGSVPNVDSILPTWAPDRNALAWTNGQVVLMDVGAGPVTLPPTVMYVTVWSPDGTLLAATDGSTLKVIGLDGTVHASIPGATDKVSWQRQPAMP